MAVASRAVASFPSVTIASVCGGAPVEVALIAQLGVGAGDRMIEDAGGRQAAHANYVDALDEPSTRLSGMRLQHGDASSLYSFTVAAGGHPFHRHATPRTFTAISGSGGARLRFSTAGDAALARDPAAFLAALRCVDIPPDSLFVVRFGGGTWHQFAPLRAGHSALFALSIHTNELDGPLSAAQRHQVEANAASIPALTELLPERVARHIEATGFDAVPTVALSLHAAPQSSAERLCASVRTWVGRLRAAAVRRRPNGGFLGRLESARPVRALERHPPESLLHAALPGGSHWDDGVEVVLDADAVGGFGASALLARVLEGFLENRPAGVSRLMALRNLVVSPLRLRTSPLGCPVSSLLSTDRRTLFAGRFPVLGQAVADDDRSAQVLLGADDRHLVFRSCVSVVIDHDGRARIRLGTRVRTRNAFGTFYMASIDLVHRHYIAPTLLRMAVDHAVAPDLVAPAVEPA